MLISADLMSVTVAELVKKWLEQYLFHCDELSFKYGYVCISIYQFS